MAKIVEVAVVEQWSFVTPHRAPPEGSNRLVLCWKSSKGIPAKVSLKSKVSFSFYNWKRGPDSSFSWVPQAGYRPIPDQGFRVGEEFRSGQWHTRTLTKMTLQPC